jgi:DNA-nicking Smr family endonuclease
LSSTDSRTGEIALIFSREVEVVDFGDILDEWDSKRKRRSKTPQDSEAGEAMDAWLDRYPAVDKDDVTGPTVNDSQAKAARRSALRRMAPQAEIDLHGFTACEAVAALDSFIGESVQKGLKKVLIIHGKGHHSRQGVVLKKLVAEYLSKHPMAGENGLSERDSGGSGARWVLLRQRSR